MLEHFYTSIPGWFDYSDLYKEMVELAPDQSHFVEVGCWKGRSAAFMAVEIVNSGKQIKFDCVDCWTGLNSKSERDPDVVNNRLYETFCNNMKPVEGHYTAVRALSIEAAKNYQDNSLDFVFIDASHDTKSVIEDINSWLPKIKSGGYIAGHDYNQTPVKVAVENCFPAVNIQRRGISWLTQK